MANSYDEETYDPNDHFPRVHPDLVEALEERFPDKCPALGTPEREVWAAVGRAEVVRFLREMSKRVPNR